MKPILTVSANSKNKSSRKISIKMATDNPPTSLPAQTTRRSDRERSEVSLSGGGNPWVVHFASKEDLSDAITFRRGVDSSEFPGTSRHTVSIFGIDGNIKFRDSRSLVVRRSDRQGRVRDLDITVWAAVEIQRQEFDVVRHEEIGNDWITLLKLKPGKRFFVTMSQMTGPPSTNPNRIRHDMLQLWNRQGDIHRMPFMAIMVRNHKTYTPWALALQKEVLGPLVSSAATGNPEDMPLIEFSDDEDSAGEGPSGEGAPEGATEGALEGAPENAPSTITRPMVDSSDDLPAAEAPDDKQASADLPTYDSPSDNGPSEESKQEESSDPFGGLWQHAMNLGKSAKCKEKE
ncbi:hypothetical protein EPUS_08066 [Endocarpon pusillum Z07020]|uniref:Uncharacterized protein n=1 Tax=Endocarpon pusillum (strain Z07020 / HMAS-L-300199) TaxID=1263415 RepID=U1GB28_ENDPU|nr:uncharacterized protein EPUS_08066 [Endocarpon pusillum Z07020]ERF68906.1 hypothetical protein EPUS_08066 [Endocarpon pusillum Z07020]